MPRSPRPATTGCGRRDVRGRRSLDRFIARAVQSMTCNPGTRTSSRRLDVTRCPVSVRLRRNQSDVCADRSPRAFEKNPDVAGRACFVQVEVGCSKPADKNASSVTLEGARRSLLAQPYSGSKRTIAGAKSRVAASSCAFNRGDFRPPQVIAKMTTFVPRQNVGAVDQTGFRRRRSQ
jgi:hypothetical protein